MFVLGLANMRNKYQKHIWKAWFHFGAFIPPDPGEQALLDKNNIHC